MSFRIAYTHEGQAEATIYNETDYQYCTAEKWGLDNLQYTVIESITEERFVHAEGVAPEFSYVVELFSVEQLLEFMELDDHQVIFYPDIENMPDLQIDCKLFCTVLKEDGLINRLACRIDFYSVYIGDIMDDCLLDNAWQVADGETGLPFYMTDSEGNYLVWEE